MSEIIDAETTAKLIKHIRQDDHESPHFQATMINFVYSLHQSDGNLDDIPLDDDEREEILSGLPTDPEKELAFLD
ncbi:hypothetical protein [Haloplanus halobius]|uniref:hypothetical protein n=1 Tax=Haloplanus halobius TaxID=2934938 RepID=UPI002010747B|nr:hypothetical protein [Haloplanus sp. XH21]